nr:hypothetical protein [Tanacetum cinerariifolium]
MSLKTHLADENIKALFTMRTRWTYVTDGIFEIQGTSTHLRKTINVDLFAAIKKFGYQVHASNRKNSSFGFMKCLLKKNDASSYYVKRAYCEVSGTNRVLWQNVNGVKRSRMMSAEFIGSGKEFGKVHNLGTVFTF